jgi:hypothetical protein
MAKSDILSRVVSGRLITTTAFRRTKLRCILATKLVRNATDTRPCLVCIWSSSASRALLTEVVGATLCLQSNLAYDCATILNTDLKILSLPALVMIMHFCGARYIKIPSSNKSHTNRDDSPMRKRMWLELARLATSLTFGSLRYARQHTSSLHHNVLS